ncbi:hypothetical protein BHE74_00040693 [Ensete ventricosum]|nr:hypothetical protein BHE74_00040693 [Ensete ventricosum]
MYEAREESMINYLTEARWLIGAFRHFTISKVLQSDNTQADALAWLASVRGSKKEPRMAKLFKPTISTPEVATTEVEYGWINEILYYKKDDSLPKDKATT